MTDAVRTRSGAVEKLPTGIASFDVIAKGGLPARRTTLVSGTAGSGKTVFAVQFLSRGIASGEAGVFVTFEESANDIRENMRSGERHQESRCRTRVRRFARRRLFTVL
jgi:circadian clock protein KaiC